MKRVTVALTLLSLQMAVANSAHAQLVIHHQPLQAHIQTLPVVPVKDIATMELVTYKVTMEMAAVENLDLSDLATVKADENAKNVNEVAIPVVVTASLPTPPSNISASTSTTIVEAGVITASTMNPANQQGAVINNIEAKASSDFTATTTEGVSFLIQSSNPTLPMETL
jgi:hypothetical protein